MLEKLDISFCTYYCVKEIVALYSEGVNKAPKTGGWAIQTRKSNPFRTELWEKTVNRTIGVKFWSSCLFHLKMEASEEVEVTIKTVAIDWWWMAKKDNRQSQSNGGWSAKAASTNRGEKSNPLKDKLLKISHLKLTTIPIMRNSGIVHKFPEKYVCSSYPWEE